MTELELAGLRAYCLNAALTHHLPDPLKTADEMADFLLRKPAPVGELLTTYALRDYLEKSLPKVAGVGRHTHARIVADMEAKGLI